MPPIPVRLVMLMMCLGSWRTHHHTHKQDDLKKTKTFYAKMLFEKWTKQIEACKEMFRPASTPKYLCRGAANIMKLPTRVERFEVFDGVGCSVAHLKNLRKKPSRRIVSSQNPRCGQSTVVRLKVPILTFSSCEVSGSVKSFNCEYIFLPLMCGERRYRTVHSWILHDYSGNLETTMFSRFTKA